MVSEQRPAFLVLSPALQTYAWGKKGSDSEACKLKASGDHEFEPDEDQTYAEVRLFYDFIVRYSRIYCALSKVMDGNTQEGTFTHQLS